MSSNTPKKPAPFYGISSSITPENEVYETLDEMDAAIQEEKIRAYHAELTAARKRQQDKLSQTICDGCNRNILYEISVMSVNARVKLCYHCLSGMANAFNSVHSSVINTDPETQLQ